MEPYKRWIHYDQLERDWWEIEGAVGGAISNLNTVITQVNYLTAVLSYGPVTPQKTLGLAANSGAAAQVSRADHSHGTPDFASIAKFLVQESKQLQQLPSYASVSKLGF